MDAKTTFTDLLTRLVAIPSVEGAAAEKHAVIELAKTWLSDHGIAVTDYPHPEAPSIVADLPGSGKPLLLLAHLDVVPAGPQMFTLRREGDTLKGRGVLDDKGPAAILMTLLAKLKEEGATHRSLRLCLTSDEEIGSPDGVQRLVKLGIFDDVEAVLALDGGAETEVIFREKGVAHITLKAVGKAAHNSMPWLGDNAIEKIIRTYESLQKAMPETSDPAHWHPTVSIGVIQGGQFVNQVPAEAMAKVDIRFTGQYEVEQVRGIIESCLEDGVTLETFSSGPAFETAQDHPLIVAYAKSMEATLGKPVTIGVEHGATDGRFFTHLKVPILIHDPLGDHMHTDEEWLSETSALAVLEGLASFVRS